jgi:small-conductance mechanosensitive channel
MQFSEDAATRNIFEYFTLGRILSVVAIVFLTWFFIRYATRLLDLLSRRGPRIRFLAKATEPVLRIVLWFVAMLISFHMLAPTRETFYAGVGSAAIAIGLGAQDLIKSLIGGLVILGDRPYQVGDLVQMGDAFGEIVHIGLRSTKLYTFGDKMVTIPNADILSKKVFDSNSGVPHCEVETFLYLPPDADPDEALRIGFEAAYTCPYLYSRKTVIVLIEDKFDQRPYQQLHIKAYVCDHRLLPRMQSDVTARAKQEFLRRGMLKSWVPSPNIEPLS